MSAEAIAMAASAWPCLLAVLVPLILTLHGRVVAELSELCRDPHALSERVACIEGADRPLAPNQRLARSGVQNAPEAAAN